MPRKEKRLRIRRREEVPEGQARLNPKSMEYLEIKKEVEIVIAGKKRYRFKAFPWEGVPENEVWCNADEMRMLGIADRTIATVRAPLKEGGEE